MTVVCSQTEKDFKIFNWIKKSPGKGKWMLTVNHFFNSIVSLQIKIEMMENKYLNRARVSERLNWVFLLHKKNPIEVDDFKILIYWHLMTSQLNIWILEHSALCDLLMCSQTGKYLLSEAGEPCDEVQKNIQELLMLPSKESKLPNFTPSHPPICTLIDIRYWW